MAGSKVRSCGRMTPDSKFSTRSAVKIPVRCRGWPSWSVYSWGVAVEAGLRVRLHDSPGQPILKSPGRRRIGVVRLVEVEMGGVIRTLEMEERLLFRADHVIRRGDDFFQIANNRRIIA